MNIINHNVLVWNIRGLNNQARGSVMRSMIQEAAASIVCQVDSKLAIADQRVVTSLLGTRFDTFVALPALG